MGENEESDLSLDEMWSCFTCGYFGRGCDEGDDGECCPRCGTSSGDGFGMAENDPRYKLQPQRRT